MPYQPPKSFFLPVIKSFDNPPLPEPLKVQICGLFSMGRSAAVLNVMTWDHIKRKRHVQAVLKLYDRRFADLRDVGFKYITHTAAREAAFQSFVRQGKMEPFLPELDEELNEDGKMFPWAGHAHLEDDTDGDAKYEAALWWKCNKDFDRETEAYKRLKDLQGKSIQRVYAHVRFMPPNLPLDLLESPLARYFEIKGILLQFIPGYSLSDLGTSQLAPSEPEICQEIVQTAVDAVHDINRRGVLIGDCGPSNVVVNSNSNTPFIRKFAQSRFKDKLIGLLKELGNMGCPECTVECLDEDEGEDEQWDPEVEYWKYVRYWNPREIGLVMEGEMQRRKGIELDIKYPDIRSIIKDIKRRKAAEGRTADALPRDT